jgi:flagellar basal-body rod modification protein FlgD
MTTVSALAPTTTTTPPAAAKSSVGDLNYNAFLKLLIAQLKDQDPTKPMDSTAFVAQLATFSQVEQSISANSKLDSLLTASDLSIADAVIGHTVTSPDGMKSGVVASVTLTRDGPQATLADGTVLPLVSGIRIS